MGRRFLNVSEGTETIGQRPDYKYKAEATLTRLSYKNTPKKSHGETIILIQH